MSEPPPSGNNAGFSVVAEDLARRSHLLAPAAAEFAERVFAQGLEKYARRLGQWGFKGHERVLDAGCGFGQWSLALAAQNRHVDAVDVASERLMVLSSLSRALGVDNLAPAYGSLTALPYADGTFDAVLCYGTLFLTPWRQSLMELRRVLAPGGTLYINANGFGWYLHLWKNRPNATNGYDPRRYAVSALNNTLAYESGQGLSDPPGLLIEPDALTDQLRRLDFNNIRMGAEGTLRHPAYTGSTEPPFFQGVYEGELGVYEILACLDP